MRSILQGEDVYPYLSDSCKERLNEIRYLARNSRILEQLVTPLSERKYAIFPWVGTRQLLTLYFALLGRGIKSKMPWGTCIYLEVYYNGSAAELEEVIHEIVESDLDVNSLPLPDKIQILNKYNEYIPLKLLRKQYIEDFLDFEGLKAAFHS
jgi:ATP-dependent Lhr-like helicase